MKWNDMFKLLGPLSKSIRQNKSGYSIVFENRTIFQFKDFSGEFISVDLSKDYMDLIGETSVKRVPKEEWDSIKIYNI